MCRAIRSMGIPGTRSTKYFLPNLNLMVTPNRVRAKTELYSTSHRMTRKVGKYPKPIHGQVMIMATNFPEWRTMVMTTLLTLEVSAIANNKTPWSSIRMQMRS